MAATALTSVLDEAGVEYEVLAHDHTETAADEARALGVPADDVAKTLVVETPSGYARAVLPASERIDMSKLADALGARRKEIHLATEEALGRDFSEFELGAVPPVGGSRAGPVVVDTCVAQRDSVVLEAGSHDESVRIAAAELIRVAGAEVADIHTD
jgi:Ala-tRNA(Pro) deacylase